MRSTLSSSAQSVSYNYSYVGKAHNPSSKGCRPVMLTFTDIHPLGSKMAQSTQTREDTHTSSWPLPFSAGTRLHKLLFASWYSRHFTSFEHPVTHEHTWADSVEGAEHFKVDCGRVEASRHKHSIVFRSRVLGHLDGFQSCVQQKLPPPLKTTNGDGGN